MLTLIKNATVFAPEPLGIRQVLVAANRIVYVSQAVPELDARLNVDEVDADGARLIPGFIDPHAHVTGGGGEAGFETSVPAPVLTDYTRAGVTTVVGLLGTDDLVRTTSAMIARIKALRSEGLSAWGYTGGYHLPPATLTGSVRSDIVHVEELIGVGEIAISDHRSSQPTFHDIVRLASEAHVAGLMTGKAGVVHFHVGDGVRGLSLIREALDTTELPARVFYPTHVNRRKALFDEAIAITARGCTIDITAFPVEEGEDAWSAEDALARYLDAGADRARVTISSDGGGCLPVFDETGAPVGLDYARADAIPAAFSALLRRGRSMEEILPAFCTNAAQLLRLAHKGRVAEGMDADLIILDKNHMPRHVMARGIWHVLDHQPIIKGTFE
jgi:beta-aspartyl-dipeptidase (metallo-type)